MQELLLLCKCFSSLIFMHIDPCIYFPWDILLNLMFSRYHLITQFLMIYYYSIGLVVGLVLCSILMSTIASAVNAVIVLFAEGPAEFEKNYPDLSKKMRTAYLNAHPGCL